MPKKKKEESTLTTDDKLDIIVEFLRRMDKRDRLRTWGGFFKGLIGLIPIVVMLGSIWYVYEHGEELLQKITQQAAKEAAAMTSDSAGDIMKQIELVFPGGTQR
jgi:hypothetical protein|tara:strand:+ start:86 stop:397 length:312 start_codon:yes stop_codon:yes gene_type:complete